jgi:acyl-CoA synthetase (AMP-forming)/AMP-acid ligase II
MGERIQSISHGRERVCLFSSQWSLDFISHLLAAALHDKPLFISSVSEDFHDSFVDPGLYLKTAGSTGIPSIHYHSWNNIGKRYLSQRPSSLKCLAVLRPFHIGGINTLLQCWFRGMTLVCPVSDHGENYGDLLQKFSVEVLPASPSYLSLMYREASDLIFPSVRMVTYGAEVMSEKLLFALHSIFPKARFHQTYGLTEAVVFKTKSRDSHSLWFQIVDPDYEIRVQKDLLYYRKRGQAKWVCTGDLVSVNGEWLKITGRADARINVGGEKVSPELIEEQIMKFEDVVDCRVFPKQNSLLGQVPVAEIVLKNKAAGGIVRSRLRKHLRTRLALWQIPVEFSIVEEILRTDSFKKKR